MLSPALARTYAYAVLLLDRYGKEVDRSPRLFGISLYQQIALELHPAGRRRFDARATLAAAGAPHPDAPYLSQVPCSWGALYFPEHWREFYAYLAARLPSPSPPSPPSTSSSSPSATSSPSSSGPSSPSPSSSSSRAPTCPATPLKPGTAVVPGGVRSNHWKRSWKRFFIELAFLRGYAMLYPSFPGARSLSTNHVEEGAHVRPEDADARERRRRLFSVPLMPLPELELGDGARSAGVRTGLLDMPGARLPAWAELPVLDLLGEVVDEATIVRRGVERRAELTGCADAPARAFDVGDLLCVHADSDGLVDGDA